MLRSILVVSLLAVVTALPSFKAKLPKAGVIPCPPDGVGCSVGIADLGEPTSVCRGIGHATCKGGSFPLNAFGADFLAASHTWTEDLCNKDSDGDGFTNGEELGDPCCLWTSGDEMSPYMDAFVPTHPGLAAHKQPDGYTRPSCDSAEVIAAARAPQMNTFNEGEEQKTMEFRIKNYTLPQVRTTYVNIPFNFNDTSADIFHIVWGTAIVVLNKHLHHFTIEACPEFFREDQVGRPIETADIPSSCAGGLGGGWAPGRAMWELASHAGIPIGHGVGIRSFVINVHFTDAEQVAETLRSTDGILMHYTPDLREYTVDSGNTILIGASSADVLTIPPGKKRFFLTRSCTLVDKCSDAAQFPDIANLLKDFGEVTGRAGGRAAGEAGDEAGGMGGMLAALGPMLDGVSTCADLATLPSFITTRLCQSIMNSICRKTCSAILGEPCEPREGSIAVVTAGFHAHLLGREMYQTLSPKSGGAKIDLGSQPAWHYDDQAVTLLMMKKISLEYGDVIQSTCVFDSTGRTEATIFGRETVDEMCFNGVQTEHLTAHMQQTKETDAVSGSAYKCTGPMWTGELGDDEDGTMVAELHPASAAAKVIQPIMLGPLLIDADASADDAAGDQANDTDVSTDTAIVTTSSADELFTMVTGMIAFVGAVAAALL